jgi:hypothetical protein
MAIPEAQLDTWSNPGAQTQSKDTYATIKGALEASDAPYSGRSCTSFLQGSYGNDTNVYADSDVDVVMKVGSIYYYDLSRLSPAEQAAFNSALGGGAAYNFQEFRRDVIGVLKKKFDPNVDTSGKKAVMVKANGSRRDADVVVSANFRRYYKYESSINQSYTEGICFFTPDGTRIENFPKQHSDNCTAKHKNTNQWFKPTVRIFKNMRNRMIQDKMIKDGLAPSYYLEGMLYNVPNDKFGKSYADTVSNCINWLWTATRNDLVCANGMFFLLRDGSQVMWSPANFEEFLKATVKLWNEWK